MQVYPEGTSFKARPSSREANVTATPGRRLGEGDRGAVWSPVPSSAFSDGGFTLRGTSFIDHEGLRSTLLLFDQIDIPDQKLLATEELERETLRSLGVLNQSFATAHGDFGTAMSRLAFETFLARDLDEPGRWALSRSALSLGVPEDQISPRQGFSLSIHNALPVFDKEVPLEDVLEFKRRHRSEILALRDFIDELCLQVSTGGTDGFAESNAYERFNRALGDYNRLMRQSNRGLLMRSLRANVDFAIPLTEAMRFAFTGAMGAWTLGGGAAYLGLRATFGLRNRRSRGTPFDYLVAADEDLNR